MTRPAGGFGNTMSLLTDALFGFAAKRLQTNVGLLQRQYLGRVNRVNRWAEARRSERLERKSVINAQVPITQPLIWQLSLSTYTCLLFGLLLHTRIIHS